MKNVDRDHAVGVDAHHRGRLAVERRGAHRLAEPRPSTRNDERRPSARSQRDDDDDPDDAGSRRSPIVEPLTELGRGALKVS